MNITVKLPSGTYAIKTDGTGMTTQFLYTGEDKNGNPIDASTNIGYYGPGQVDLAIKRIISEELNKNHDTVNLRQFLVVYKGLMEIIQPQLIDLRNAIKEQRLQETT